MSADGPDGPAERATIARRASRGFVASLVRVGLNQIAAGAALIIFARRLDGAQFALFTAFGLGAPLAYRLLTAPLSWVLIRQKAQPSGALVASVVAVVEAAVLIIGAAVLAVGAALGAWPLRVGLAAVVYVIALPLCLPTLVGLYRDVDVSRAAALEAVDRVAFYSLAAAGVLAGMGTDALVLAFLGTAGAMLVTAQLLRPWRPARPSPRSALPLLRQAIATGATIAVAAVSDLAMVPFVALLAGGHEAGLWSWAYSAAYLVPLGVVGAAMNALFAAFARLPEEALGIRYGRGYETRHGRRRRRRRAGRGRRARGRDRRLPAPLAHGLSRALDGGGRCRCARGGRRPLHALERPSLDDAVRVLAGDRAGCGLRRGPGRSAPLRRGRVRRCLPRRAGCPDRRAAAGCTPPAFHRARRAGGAHSRLLRDRRPLRRAARALARPGRGDDDLPLPRWSLPSLRACCGRSSAGP